MKRLVLAITAGVISLALTQSAHAAMKGHTVTVTKGAGSYRLVLIVGPSESMSGKKGEHMMGGKKESCSMNHMNGSGMSMSGHACNHHVELHVYNRKTGKVVSNASVMIAMTDRAKHMTINVPIARMSGGGMKDVHFGNNVYAGPGMYSIRVRVNGAKALFSIRVM